MYAKECVLTRILLFQELRLEDLKHLRNSIPKVPNGDDTISQLLDFSSITYQDVISAADTLTVYPSEPEQIIFSTASSVMIPSNSRLVNVNG